MPNWCQNHLRITKGKYGRFTKEMKRIEGEQNTNPQGQYIFGIGETAVFDVVSETGSARHFNYETKWSGNARDIYEIARKAEFGFNLFCEELGSGVFEEYKFDGRIFLERRLDEVELATVCWDDAKSSYLWNGDEIDSQTEIYELLLEAKPFVEIEIL